VKFVRLIDQHLPGSDRPLPPEWALQDPNDYLEVLKNAVPAAIKAAGKQPGKDIQIVTIDGTKGGLEAIAAGELGASVQSSPFFGPLACDVAQKFAKGETVPPWVKVSDRFYDKSNVKESMQYGY